ncbi:tannase/feruloyl esterase family alpha/beta hydrolase [Bailinhaonella thermotolerans]|uniref:Tannase/feruloyl esterase family alpha/beta hydrolase n=1 Tax=Bailinhaonella thermotolerans TaxID=1070861 RepID=A0A3A4B5P8_9ACTN|nr:tannase/feruloyl esterase family alpha/beta hydrolase [Bailinhaonella thermotolerans]RJL35950.1 tannase/feruloyl esterase family alpha/beta hydrolase [Bailinhaonella thermotolerans]
MRRIFAVAPALLLALAAASLTAAPAGARAEPAGARADGARAGLAGAPTGPRPCAELTGTAIPASAIGLPTTGGEVTAAQPVPAAGPIGEYCRVDAAIHPVDPAAPDIRVRLALPSAWNRKAMMFGGGGYNGTIPDVAGNVPFGPADAPVPLARGYATFASDSGHQAPPDFLPAPSLDGSFGVNDEAVRNFAGDALKKTRDAAMFLIAARYGGARPAYAYFAGGSTGGREALAVAQRWPADFDGVISVYPAWNAASLDLFFGHEARVLSRPGAFPGPAEQALLHASVIKACDGLDGLRDGVISDEAGCRYDPRALRCPRGADAGDHCLSDEQIRAVVAISSPLRWPYRIASGERGYPGFPFLSGADMTTRLVGMGTTAPARPMPKTSGYGVQFWDQWVRFFVTRDPRHDPLAIDPLRPGPWRERISELSALQDVNDPDLRPFAAAGGKLLILHGTADELVSHRSTVEYFRRVQRTVGERATRRFARLYLVPGANHVNIDTPFAAGWDSVTALETWAERGQAPARPVVTDKNPQAGGRTRPLCEHPAWPAYDGSGDPASAASFTCRTSRWR